MNFANLWNVAMRDFNAVVRTKGFVIGLLFLPAIMTVSVALPRLLARFGEQGDRRFAVADFTGRLAAPLAKTLDEQNAAPGQKLKVLVEPIDLAARGMKPQDFDTTREQLATELNERVRSKELFGYLLIGPRVAEIPAAAGSAPAVEGAPDGGAARSKDDVVIYGAVSLTAGDLRDTMRNALNDCVKRDRLAQEGVDPALMERINRRPELEEFVVSRTEGVKAERSSGMKEGLVPIGILILLMMGIMQSAGILLNATIEEKSNRVVEVLLSSVRPFELLAGKILGAWLTGLVVLLVWGGAASFTADHFGVLRAEMLSASNLAWDAFFFVTGYLLFASLYGAIGAMCSSIQDAQNMMMPIVLLIMIPMMGMAHVIEHPDSVVTTALTFFPFSAALIMPMRLAQSPPPPLWQLLGAATSVTVSAIFLMWIGGKVFRMAILMTGKPPKPSEIWRMLREA